MTKRDFTFETVNGNLPLLTNSHMGSGRHDSKEIRDQYSIELTDIPAVRQRIQEGGLGIFQGIHSTEGFNALLDAVNIGSVLKGQPGILEDGTSQIETGVVLGPKGIEVKARTPVYPHVDYSWKPNSRIVWQGIRYKKQSEYDGHTGIWVAEHVTQFLEQYNVPLLDALRAPDAAYFLCLAF